MSLINYLLRIFRAVLLVQVSFELMMRAKICHHHDHPAVVELGPSGSTAHLKQLPPTVVDKAPLICFCALDHHQISREVDSQAKSRGGNQHANYFLTEQQLHYFPVLGCQRGVMEGDPVAERVPQPRVAHSLAMARQLLEGLLVSDELPTVLLLYQLLAGGNCALLRRAENEARLLVSVRPQNIQQSKIEAQIKEKGVALLPVAQNVGFQPNGPERLVELKDALPLNP